MQSILVPLDGSERSERALGFACWLAASSGARLHLVAAPWEGVAVDLARYLEDQARWSGLARVSTSVEQGPPVDAIVRAAHALDDPVVCMGTHGRSSVGQVLLGSVSEGVLRRCTVPVVLLGPTAGPLAERSGGMLVCSDGSDCADAIVVPAAGLAARLDMPVTVVEVVGPEETVAPAGGECVDHVTIAARRRLDDVADRLVRAGAPDVGVEVLYGADPAGSIVHRAQQHAVALVALATHGRSGLARVVLGSVAMRTVHHSPCPVLTVRPATLDS
jgi:nucleotide-binding universal stress UspA family protein